MFTGIVEALGTVMSVQRYGDAARLRLLAPNLTEGMRLGDSLAVNGVCLTVATIAGDTLEADVIAQTLLLSGIGSLAPGDRVNLERAMPASGRFGGHHVQGHIDATGSILNRRASEHWDVLTISIPSNLSRYVVAQGSIAVEGVSLTVIDVDGCQFSVGLIPETLARTTLAHCAIGTAVNLEVDILAKYIERLLSAPSTSATAGETSALRISSKHQVPLAG
ncbi:riboflavin synthase [Cellulomonas xiejunii]|uniref:riboflavin synthase n=1 Tax=Cellulomonas xiejunii TaxID=2968083 RepID=UPI001D0E00A0|nr:riboflavin synthase [Cellulomonas xiejunii]MCC2314008.1 riboflavin synthase [Cellulomonas xiejunii]